MNPLFCTPPLPVACEAMCIAVDRSLFRRSFERYAAHYPHSLATATPKVLYHLVRNPHFNKNEEYE